MLRIKRKIKEDTKEINYRADTEDIKQDTKEDYSLAKANILKFLNDVQGQLKNNIDIFNNMDKLNASMRIVNEGNEALYGIIEGYKKKVEEL